MRAFTVIELLISIAIVAILVGILLPALGIARETAHTSLCASNLKQIGTAWQLYLEEHDQFPRHTSAPDWRYGGVVFVGADQRAILDVQRPINAYMESGLPTGEAGPVTRLFECPSDKGIFPRSSSVKHAPPSILPGGATAYEHFGTSYRANPFLMDSTAAKIDALKRPLTLSEIDIAVNASRMLLMGDPVWFYASMPEGTTDPALDASWHRRRGAGNMLAVDGSIRFMEFSPGSKDVTLSPNPKREPDWTW